MHINHQDQGSTRGFNKVNPIQLVNISQTQTEAIPNLVDFSMPVLDDKLLNQHSGHSFHKEPFQGPINE